MWVCRFEWICPAKMFSSSSLFSLSQKVKKYRKNVSDLFCRTDIFFIVQVCCGLLFGYFQKSVYANILIICIYVYMCVYVHMHTYNEHHTF